MVIPWVLTEAGENLLSSLSVQLKTVRKSNQLLKCGEKNAHTGLILPPNSKQSLRGKEIMVPLQNQSCTQSPFLQSMWPMGSNMNPLLFKSTRTPVTGGGEWLNLRLAETAV